MLRGQDGEAEDLARRVATWKPAEVLAVGDSADVCKTLKDAKVTPLADEAAVSAAYLRRQLRRGKIETLVIANPADAAKGTPLSRMAPALALQRRAVLMLTNEAGDNTAALVRAALKNDDLRRVENLILLADLKAIPTERRKNPAAGKDEEIEMEPLTPEGDEPFTFATGRLFADDPGLVALMLARQRLMVGSGPRKAVIASNPGGGLPLLELFSRHTVREMKNHGYETTAMFEDDVKPEPLRRAWPDADIFLWEGHYRTMIDDFKVPTWTEPLKPSLVFLQSCLALNPAEVKTLFNRGAVAVVGSATAHLFGLRRRLHVGVLRCGHVRRSIAGQLAAAGQEFPVGLFAAQTGAIGRKSEISGSECAFGLGVQSVGRSDTEIAAPRTAARCAAGRSSSGQGRSHRADSAG